MKAISIQTPHSCELVDIPEPAAPRSGEVRLRVRQVGYCGSDLTSYRGLNSMVSYPRIPGHEIGAVIDSIGPDVPAEWPIGKNVLVSPYTHCGTCAACRAGRFNTCRSNQTMGMQRDGALTEYIVVPYEKLFSSAQLSLKEIALVEPLTVGFHAVARGEVTALDTVVVFGCGAIGLGVIAGASARRARVIAGGGSNLEGNLTLTDASRGILGACDDRGTLIIRRRISPVLLIVPRFEEKVLKDGFTPPRW